MSSPDDQQTTVLPSNEPPSQGSESAWAALFGLAIAVFAVLVLVFRPHRLTFLVGTILLIVTIVVGLIVAAVTGLAAVTSRRGPIARRALTASSGGDAGQGRGRSGWGKPRTWIKLVTALAGLLLAASTLLTVVHKPSAVQVTNNRHHHSADHHHHRKTTHKHHHRHHRHHRRHHRHH